MTYKKVLLEELCTLITDGSHSSPKAVKNGYTMLSVKDMGEFDFNYDNSKEISKDDYLKLVSGNCQPKVNDVLIAKDGNSCLEYCFVFRENKEVVLLSSIAILRPDTSKVNPFYLMYYLGTEKAKKELKEGYLSGSAIPRVVLKDFKKYPLFVPDIEVQNRIVELIGSINSKIENNLGIIKNFESLSQTLFKHWFINYEFPNEEGIPYKLSGGIMVESEIGEIPEGWKVGELQELANKLYAGGTPSRKKEEYWINGSIPWLKTKEIKNKYIINAEESITKEGLEGSSAKWIPSHSVVVAMYGATAGQLGYLAMEMTSNQACCAIVSDIPNFMYSYLRLNQERLTDLATGSAQQNLSKDIISKFKIICPPKEILTTYETVVSNFSEQIIELTKENNSLVQLRDTLLPKLLSGEVEIPDESVEEIYV